jgi:hypothetical protein
MAFWRSLQEARRRTPSSSDSQTVARRARRGAKPSARLPRRGKR